MNISIIIPTHNRKDLLIRALESLLNQTFNNFECVVHDNFSTDGTEEVLKEWIQKSQPDFKINYYKSSKSLPILENWKQAVDKAKYDYIKILWDDDWLERNALEIYTNAIVENKVDGVISSAFIVKNNKNQKNYVTQNENFILSKEDVVDSLFAFQKSLPFSPSASLLKKDLIFDAFEVFEYPGFCRENVIGIDFLINYIGVFQDKKILKINKSLAYLDASEDSITENTLSRNLGMCYFSALFKICTETNYKLNKKYRKILEFLSLYNKVSTLEGFFLPNFSINYQGIKYVFRYLLFKINQRIDIKF